MRADEASRSPMRWSGLDESPERGSAGRRRELIPCPCRGGHGVLHGRRKVVSSDCRRPGCRKTRVSIPSSCSGVGRQARGVGAVQGYARGPLLRARSTSDGGRDSDTDASARMRARGRRGRRGLCRVIGTRATRFVGSRSRPMSGSRSVRRRSPARSESLPHEHVEPV